VVVAAHLLWVKMVSQARFLAMVEMELRQL
jgi:hypothetical protein